MWATIPIKISICWTLKNFAKNKIILGILYTMMFVAFANSLGTNLYLLTSCNKVEAHWDQSVPGAKCRPASSTVAVGNVYSAINIIVDWV